MSEASRPRAPFFARFTLIAVLFFFYAPFVTMIWGAFRDDGGFTLRWFSEVLADEGLVDGLWNSLQVALVSSCVATVLGTAAAISLSRGPFAGRRLLEALSTVSLILPEIVFALALLSWFFLLKVSLSLVTVVVAHVTFSLSYVLLTVGARLSTLPSSLEDAAKDLGAGELGYLFKVLLPILRPAIFSGFLLGFLLSFDDFLITFFVNGVGTDTLPIKLYTAMKMGLTPKLNALSTLMWAVTSFLLILSFRSTAFRDLLKAGDTPNEQH